MKPYLIKSMAILSLLLFTACSTQLSYRFADWIIAWSIDDYIDWTRVQETDFEQRLDKLISWHQSTQLTLYAQLLTDLKQDLQKPLSNKTVNQYNLRIQVLTKAIAQQIQPHATALLSTLSDKQVDELMSNINNKNQQLKEDYIDIDPKKLHDQRMARVQSIVERLTGSINQSQEEAVQAWSLKLINSQQSWLDNRLARSELFFKALLNRHNASFNTTIYQLMLEPETLSSTSYQQSFDEKMTDGLDLVINLHQHLDEEQQGHLIETLDDYIEDFHDLAQ